MSEVKAGYQSEFERHYSAVLGMVRYFFTQLADEAIEIAARAVMLAAPMPNAISMFNITQREQGFTPFQAFAFSLTLEIVVFLLVEIALIMWNGYLVKPKVYRWPFVLMVGVVLIATFIVVSMVYALEPHKVMAWLPVISLCSFAAIGLKRWHERSENAIMQSNQDTQYIDELRTQLESERSSSDDLRTSLDSVRNDAERLRIESESLRTQLESERNRADMVDIDSVLERLDGTSKEVFLEIIDAIENGRVTSAADAAKTIKSSKTKVYEMFRLATAINAIYPNGDGAYHVRN